MEQCKTILLVEDDPSLLVLLQLVIENTGLTCYVAEDAASGFQEFCLRQPDLLITDLEMPQRSGAHLVDDVKGINRNFPVILMTANQANPLLLDIFRFPRLLALRKPVTESTLFAAIQAVQALLPVTFSQQRYYFRVPVEMEATLGHFGQARIKNLSLVGVAFEYEKSLKVGGIVPIKFDSIECNARVVWNRAEKGYGAVFEALSEKDSRRIRSILLNEIGRSQRLWFHGEE